MSKFKKIMLCVSLALACVFFILSQMLIKFSDGKKTPIEYPESGLSNDLFVSQNTEYIENSTLSIEYSFINVPYICDLIDGNVAEIEEGHIVNASEDVNFFVTEFKNEKNPHDVILRQYPQTLYINYAKESSFIQTATSDVGYINGYYATYFVDHLLISTGPTASSKSAYMIGYVIDLGKEYDYDLIVAVATTTQSTENFQACKKWLDAITQTLRFEEKRAEEMKKAAEKAYLEEQKVLEEYAEASQQASSNVVSNVMNAIESDIPVTVKRDFDNMTILITWDNPCESPVISFENADGLVLGTPSSLGSKQAIINVGKTIQGSYILSCSHFKEAGSINIRLVEN